VGILTEGKKIVGTGIFGILRQAQDKLFGLMGFGWKTTA
jgi:hypothetical protein